MMPLPVLIGITLAKIAKIAKGRNVISENSLNSKSLYLAVLAIFAREIS
jgi:hypothetical protein